MRVLIIGYGSIGKRHFEILNTFKTVTRIDIVTKQNIQHAQSYFDIKDIDDLAYYDYFIIASETVKHFGQLQHICSRVTYKKILVEKPLYDTSHDKIKTTNQIFTAYNLRFHPILVKLKEELKAHKIYYANIICGQYLPTWRSGQDYRNTYSADIYQGGGVLRDLSHEIDYMIWLFGDIKKLDSINTKVSDLEINSDDIFTAIGVSYQNIIVNLSLDYISKTPIRKLIIHTQSHTIQADLVRNTIMMSDKSAQSTIIECKKIDRNYTYRKMHEAILNDVLQNVCSYTEGSEIVNVVDTISYKEFLS